MKLPVKQLLIALCAVGTIYALVLVLTGEGQSRGLFARLFSPAGLAAIALCVLNYLLRGLRWRMWMAHYQRPLGILDGLRLYLAGYTFTPTPGNVGEAMRGLLLTHKPLNAGQSLSIFGAERLSDLVCLLVLSLPGLWWLLIQTPVGQSAWLPALSGGALLACALAAFLLIKLTPALTRRFPWLQQAWECLATRPLRWFALTLVAWAAQGLAMWLICVENGLEMGFLQATGFYALAMVGGALSMLPAGLGGMEALLTGLLMAHGAALGVAAGITVLVRLLTLWLAVAIGALTLLYSAAFPKDISLR